MLLVVIDDETIDPVDVCFFCADAEMFEPHSLADFFQELRFNHRNIPCILVKQL